MKNTPTNKIPILTYHSIDESRSVISTSCETFRRQMKFLCEEAFNVISLKDLTRALDANNPLPPKTIVLTFDDGFQNFYTIALPILKELDFTATVFLITGFCGKYNDWTGNLAGLERSELMDWNEIKECRKHGIEFGSHTQTHPDLTKISIEKAKQEIIGSKSKIEEKLGIEVADFAYPYGKYNQAVKNITGDNFKTSCSTELGKYRAGDDLFSLKRLDTYYLSNERIFRSMLSDNFDKYINFRRTMRDLKSTWYSK